MANKDSSRLGRGLDSLFGQQNVTDILEDIENGKDQRSQLMIPVSEIRPNPYQPRKIFNKEALEELSLSIQQHGVFTPILVKKSISGYELITGERRWRASKMANLEEIKSSLNSNSALTCDRRS